MFDGIEQIRLSDTDKELLARWNQARHEFDKFLVNVFDMLVEQQSIIVPRTYLEIQCTGSPWIQILRGKDNALSES